MKIKKYNIVINIIMIIIILIIILFLILFKKKQKNSIFIKSNIHNINEYETTSEYITSDLVNSV